MLQILHVLDMSTLSMTVVSKMRRNTIHNVVLCKTNSGYHHKLLSRHLIRAEYIVLIKRCSRLGRQFPHFLSWCLCDRCWQLTSIQVKLSKRCMQILLACGTHCGLFAGALGWALALQLSLEGFQFGTQRFVLVLEFRNACVRARRCIFVY